MTDIKERLHNIQRELIDRGYVDVKFHPVHSDTERALEDAVNLLQAVLDDHTSQFTPFNDSQRPTPTARQEALDALNKLGDSSSLSDTERNALEMTIRAALTQPGVPVIPGLREALKDYECASDAILGKNIDVLAKAAQWVADNQPGESK